MIRYRAGETLGRAASVAFLLLAAALPWSVAPISIALVATAALTLAACLVIGGRRWVRTPLDLPTLGWIAALALSAAFAHDPHASWPRVTKGFLLLLVPVAAYHALNERLARRWVAILFVSAAAAALYALARFVAKGAAFPSRVVGAVGHPLTYGGQAMLLAVLATAVFVVCRGRWRWGAAALLALLLPALAGTYTRSAWLGYVAGAAFVIALSRARRLVPFGILLAILVFFLPGVYRERAFSIVDPSSPWNAQRVHMWEAGLRMLRDHPWTGVGLQDLHAVYERYKSTGATEAAGHLHSIYVQVGATMGAVGLLALAWLMIGFWRTASRGIRTPREGPDAPREPPGIPRDGLGAARDGLGAAISVGVSAGLVGFFLSGTVEWNLGDEELLDLLCALIGISFAASGWPRRVSSSAPSRNAADTTRRAFPSPRAGAPGAPSPG